MFIALIALLIVCALLSSIFYNRLALLLERLKLLQKERRFEYKQLFRLEGEKKPHLVRQEEEHYLKLLEHQTALTMKRAKWIQKSLFCFIMALSSLLFALFCSLLNGPSWDLALIGLFILAILLLFTGIIFVLCELKALLNPIQQESEFVQTLIRDDVLKDS